MRDSVAFMPSTSSRSKLGTPPIKAFTLVFEMAFTPFSASRGSTRRVPFSRIQLSPLCAPRDPRRTARRCHKKIDVPSAPTAKPATV
jgi:hypothetical protein